VDTVLEFWGTGSKIFGDSSNGGKEAGLLYLNCDKAADQLGWRPLFDFRDAVQQTVNWYKHAAEAKGGDNQVWRLTQSQIDAYAKWPGEKMAVAG
jgi:CDP-glucose 4,6-dehydratase